MSSLLIIGAGGHGKTVADAALASGLWQDIVFLDDAWPERSSCGRWEIQGDTSRIADWRGKCAAAIVALGNNRLRLELQQRLLESGHSIATIIHPSAQISHHAHIGAGSVILANCVVSVDVVIGEAAIINTAATVDHDCRLGRGAHLAPGCHLGGGVHIGECAWLGIGSAVRHGIKIGSNAVVPPGSVVVNDIVDQKYPD